LPSIAGVSGEDQPVESMLGHIRRSTRCGVWNIELPTATGLSGELPPDTGVGTAPMQRPTPLHRLGDCHRLLTPGPVL
jgi:hypothetical protein